MKNNEKYTGNELSEERTLLAFIRTCAIFCGLYILLKKNIKFAYSSFIPILIALILLYRLIYIDHTAHKMYIRSLGGTLLICIVILIIYS
tara:strand:+ start:1469 stop:1738 length:270 start_codon:yes stop_codon:yes gene_type:complete